MCGIVGAIAQRDVVPILMEGLRRLEYRGYDSAGVALRTDEGRLQRIRSVGKVAELQNLLDTESIVAPLGIAHTRWATHGMPAERNAHPHMSGEQVAVVHNGIIENHAELRAELEAAGFTFHSETDTEVIAHLLASLLSDGLSLGDAVRQARSRLVGAYGMAVVSPDDPDRMVVARAGSPLVIGLGVGENFIASDVFALLPVTQRFIFLEEGDMAEITRDSVRVCDADGNGVQREERISQLSASTADKGPYRHYMLKEIHEQPAVIAETLEGRIHKGHLLEESFGHIASTLLDQAKGVHIIACGTSYHAGLVAKYWLEEIGIPCHVEVASEYRYRRVVVPQDTLFVSISQSGETADTLAALRAAKRAGYLGSLVICNVPESSLVRESDVALMTRAGPEIGVASTKAFTTQLVALRLLTIALARRHGLSEAQEKALVDELEALPRQVEVVLQLSDQIAEMANAFADMHNALFLGRGTFYPIALEGALKLKEISYIHAEGYPAGEMKHGPIALIDQNMPVVFIAIKDSVYEKVLSNIEEVRARRGRIIAIATEGDDEIGEKADHVIYVPETMEFLTPLLTVIPLQLLAYHIAVLRGCAIDQPRNLAKSVTVE